MLLADSTSPSIGSEISPPDGRFKNRTIRCSVSSERQRSKSSCSSKCVPSIFRRVSGARKSKKYCNGKSGSASCNLLNSRVSFIHVFSFCTS